jgi:hypothetical protein
MLYEVDEKSGVLRFVKSSWAPRELDIEKYLITREDGSPPILSEAVFGEPLLLLSNQVRTRNKKRADILAMDRAGNGVVIELKRDQGHLGVETQALQYLADFSAYSGKNFIKKFGQKDFLSEDVILGFVGDNAGIEDLNRNSRVILMARSFDSTLFSMGEWLSSKGISFRCITYSPVEIEGKKLLSFSVVFDRANEALYPVSFASTVREPGYYWHNIASANQDWWRFLVDNQQIPACFENSPGDQGEKILTRYIPGDIIVAYAKGFGAVGWGVVTDPAQYRLIAVGDKADRLAGNCRHRLQVRWEATAKVLSEGFSPETVREQFGIYHPVSTSVSIDSEKCRSLMERMHEKFNT